MTEHDFLDSLVLVIDSREQAPYSFPGHRTARGALPVGDYSIAGLEEHVSIERKSLDDLLGCLTSGRERFERELMKARPYRYFAIVVERPLNDILEHRYQSGVEPESAFQSIMAFSVRYNRLPFFFCRGRREAERVTLSLLIKAARECWKEFSAIVKAAELSGGREVFSEMGERIG